MKPEDYDIRESYLRTIAKTISWRILASLILFFLIFFAVADTAIATGISILDFVIKSILYYIHERSWNRVKWGKEQIG